LAELVDRRFTVDALEMLFSQALQNRPDYQRAVLSSEATTAQLHGARGEWLPRVDAFVTAGRSSEHFTNGSGDYAAGATVSFNLFDAARKSRIARATATQWIAHAEEEQLANQIRFEVVRAYQQYVTARERRRWWGRYRLRRVKRCASCRTDIMRALQQLLNCFGLYSRCGNRARHKQAVNAVNYPVSGIDVFDNDSRTVNKNVLMEINFEVLSLLSSGRFDLFQLLAVKPAAHNVIPENSG
jgi:hypothetical protein